MNTRQDFARKPKPRIPGPFWLLFAVFAAPLAWIVQLVIGYGFASYPCFRGHVALTTLPPGWESLRGWLIALALSAMAIALAGIAASWSALGRAATLERQGEAATGRIQRTRSLGRSGIVSSVIFLAAILFMFAMLVRVPPCSG